MKYTYKVLLGDEVLSQVITHAEVLRRVAREGMSPEDMDRAATTFLRAINAVEFSDLALDECQALVGERQRSSSHISEDVRARVRASIAGSVHLAASLSNLMGESLSEIVECEWRKRGVCR